METKSHQVQVFVQSCTVETILAFLSSIIGDLQAQSPFGEESKLFKHNGTEIIIQPSEDDFLSIFVLGSDLWSTSPEFARHITQNIHCLVRCDPETEFPEINPYSDVFLQISEGVETLITWI